MKYWVKSVSILFLLFSASIALADSASPGKVIAGWVEKISFTHHDLAVKVKLDTGAKTSSIFAKDIKNYKRDGDNWVDFTLVLQDDNDKIHTTAMSAPRSRRVRIKNHDGDHDRRVVVEIPFCFDGRMHEAEFTLADRSEYIYPVLLGRSFLEKVAVVDPDATFLTKASCHPAKKLNVKQTGKAHG